MKYTKEQIKSAISDIFALSIRDASLKYKVAAGTIYLWRKKYKNLLGTDKEHSPLKTAPCPHCHNLRAELKELDMKNSYLEVSIAERDDQISSLKKFVITDSAFLSENTILKNRIEELGSELGLYMRLVKHYMRKCEE